MFVIGKVVLFGQEWLYSGKSCSLPESGSIWGEENVIGQNGWTRSKVVVFGQSG